MFVLHESTRWDRFPVGNGEFGFTVDASGLQTSEEYEREFRWDASKGMASAFLRKKLTH